MDRVVGLPRGFAYVEYETRADAERAKLHMDGGQLDGNVITCVFRCPESYEKSRNLLLCANLVSNECAQIKPNPTHDHPGNTSVSAAEYRCCRCRVDFLLVLKRKPAPAPAKLPSPPPRSKDRPRDGDRPREGRTSERHGERSAARPSDRDRERRGSGRGGRGGSPPRRRRSPSPRRRCQPHGDHRGNCFGA